MDKKQLLSKIKKMKKIKNMEIKEFVKNLKEIYVIDTKNVYWILKGNRYYRSNCELIDLLCLQGFNILDKVIFVE